MPTSPILSQLLETWPTRAGLSRVFRSDGSCCRVISHRIADPRIIGLIGQWLRAGVMEGGKWTDALEGTPQGVGISPLLANIFLYYVPALVPCHASPWESCKIIRRDGKG